MLRPRFLTLHLAETVYTCTCPCTCHHASPLYTVYCYVDYQLVRVKASRAVGTNPHAALDAWLGITRARIGFSIESSGDKPARCSRRVRVLDPSSPGTPWHMRGGDTRTSRAPGCRWFHRATLQARAAAASSVPSETPLGSLALVVCRARISFTQSFERDDGADVLRGQAHRDRSNDGHDRRHDRHTGDFTVAAEHWRAEQLPCVVL